MDVTYTAIGEVSSRLDSDEEAPRQGSQAAIPGRIEVFEPYRKGLQKYTADRVVVIWHAHLADRTVLESDRYPGRGIFTTRSQDRPNPIGLTECQVRTVDASGIDVEGIDMVDGTPVLDLKPPL